MAGFPGQFLDLTKTEYVTRIIDVLGEAGVTPERIEACIARYAQRVGLRDVAVSRTDRAFTVTLPNGVLRRTAPLRKGGR